MGAAVKLQRCEMEKNRKAETEEEKSETEIPLTNLNIESLEMAGNGSYSYAYLCGSISVRCLAAAGFCLQPFTVIILCALAPPPLHIPMQTKAKWSNNWICSALAFCCRTEDGRRFDGVPCINNNTHRAHTQIIAQFS